MNPPDATLWIRCFGVIAIEITLIFAVIYLATLSIGSVLWRKTFWQAALISSLLIVAINVSGVENGLAVWLTGKKPLERKVVAKVLARNESLPGMVVESELPLSDVAESSVLLKAVWWPGMLWLAGVSFVLLRILFARALLLVLCWRRTETSDSTLLERISFIREQFGIRREVRVLTSETIRSPIAFGILRPSIALPSTFQVDFSPAQQDAMLAHELAHLAGRDPFWYLLADVTSAILWWHPMVWLARRRLQIVSELAADEATSILENGPGTLAECLVHLGRELSVAPSFGWLGIEGGFRSTLGQRVERLLNLRQAGGSPRKATMFIAKMALTFFAVGLVALTSGWAQNKRAIRTGDLSTNLKSGWSSSTGAFLLAALQSSDAADSSQSKETNNKKPKPVGIKEAPSTAPVLETNKEVSKANDILTLAPTKQSTTTIAAKNENAAASKSVAKNVNATSPQRRAIISKLEAIKLDEVEFDNLPLSDCLKNLTEQAVLHDDQKAGVNFLILSQEAAAIRIHISPGLKKLRLGDALDAIVASALKPIRYEVRDYGVAFSEYFPEAPALFTRNWKVDSHAVTEALRPIYDSIPSNGAAELLNHPGTIGDFPGVAGRTIAHDGSHGGFMTKTNATRQWNDALRLFFSQAGVEWTAEKAVFFNDRTGIILVRATQKDLEIVETAIQTLAAEPSQVLIEAKFVEMNEATLKSLGLDWSLSDGRKQATDGRVDPVKTQPIRINYSDTALVGTNLQGNNLSASNSVLTNVTGILNEAEFQKVVRTLEKKDGVDVLSAPRVTTLSGRQAQISVLDLRTVVTGVQTIKNAKGGLTNQIQTAQLPCGPVLDIIPYVSADGFSINMTVIATVNEFLGYDKPDEKLKAVSKTAEIPLPRTRVRQALTSVNVRDGQTVVLGGLVSDNALKMKDKVPILGDLPLIGKMFRSESTGTEKRNLMVFVTPRIIDSAGNSLHSEEELAKISKSK